jgi:pSer/pThr/pTyr-binding forkhead associated (FHA) protein
MVLKLLVKEGLRKDDELTIKSTVTLGRSKGDLLLKDPKSSSLHAKITLLQGGKFEIEDLKSLNGTYVNHQKITKIILQKGDQILIGRTLLEVLEAGIQSEFEPDSWQGTIDRFLLQQELFYEKLPHKKSFFKPFKKPLCLEVTKGMDKGKKFYFSYGPKTISSDSLETPLLTEGSFFELHSNQDKNCELVSKNSDLIINDASFEKKILENGDRISIGQIEFIVKF